MIVGTSDFRGARWTLCELEGEGTARIPARFIQPPTVHIIASVMPQPALQLFEKEIARLEEQIAEQKVIAKDNMHDPVALTRATAKLKELHIRLDVVKKNYAKAAGAAPRPS
ncbi:MAG: hypothetical protein JO205_13545 [Pseudolabrys sp.]|nr:hypothetical protein [Pseudolabrys sp.]